jgi:hypothetical protein
MANSWDEYLQLAKRQAIPLPPAIASNLYEIYAYLNDQRCAHLKGRPGYEDWERLSVGLRRQAAEAAASHTMVNVPALLLNQRYDEVLRDFYAPLEPEEPGPQ